LCAIKIGIMDVTVKKFNLQKTLPNNKSGHEFWIKGIVFKNSTAQSKFTKCKCQRNRPIFVELPRIVEWHCSNLLKLNEILYEGRNIFT